MVFILLEMLLEIKHMIDIYMFFNTCAIVHENFLCRHSIFIGKENACTHINFCVTIIILFLSENERKTEITILITDVDVNKYIGQRH